jgi:hypothetical protein
MLPERISRVAFAVPKVRIGISTYFLMRRNAKWNDISFVGGHANERDSNSLMRSARRELLEEVPSLRTGTSFGLAPLTNELCFGPVWSKSASMIVGYEMQFFGVIFRTSPVRTLNMRGPRSGNVLVPMQALLAPERFKISQLVGVLDWAYPGGLADIPYSWSGDLANELRGSHNHLDEQLELIGPAKEFTLI